MGANYLFINASRLNRCASEPHNFTQPLHTYSPDGKNRTSDSQATMWVWISNRLGIKLLTPQAWEAPAQRVHRSAAIFVLDLRSATGCDLCRMRHRRRLSSDASLPPAAPPVPPVPLCRRCRLGFLCLCAACVAYAPHSTRASCARSHKQLKCLPPDLS